MIMHKIYIPLPLFPARIPSEFSYNMYHVIHSRFDTIMSKDHFRIGENQDPSFKFV